MKDTTFEEQSSLKIYSLGIVVKAQDPKTGEILVSPIETMNVQTPGAIADTQSEFQGTHPDEKGIATEGQVSAQNYIKATWICIGTSNRVTPPTVYPNETVLLYRYSNNNVFYWTSIFHEADLRKKESATFGFSNLSNAKGWSGETPIAYGKDTGYWVEVDAIKQMVSLTTPGNDGEFARFTFEIDVASAALRIKDNRKNEVVIDSRKGIDITTNLVVNIQGTNEVNVKSDGPVNIKAGGSVNVSSPSVINLNAPVVKVSGSLSVGGGLSVAGKMSGGGGMNASGSITIGGSIKAGNITCSSLTQGVGAGSVSFNDVGAGAGGSAGAGGGGGGNRPSTTSSQTSNAAPAQRVVLDNKPRETAALQAAPTSPEGVLWARSQPPAPVRGTQTAQQEPVTFTNVVRDDKGGFISGSPSVQGWGESAGGEIRQKTDYQQRWEERQPWYRSVKKLTEISESVRDGTYATKVGERLVKDAQGLTRRLASPEARGKVLNALGTGKIELVLDDGKTMVVSALAPLQLLQTGASSRGGFAYNPKPGETLSVSANGVSLSVVKGGTVTLNTDQITLSLSPLVDEMAKVFSPDQEA